MRKSVVPEKYKATMRRYYQKNADYLRKRERERYAEGSSFETHLKRNYGITLADYNAMLAAQGNKCKIQSCETTAAKQGRRLAVDHCHTTGKVRGLLCNNCNRALGHARDSIERLQQLIVYLKEA